MTKTEKIEKWEVTNQNHTISYHVYDTFTEAADIAEKYNLYIARVDYIRIRTFE